MRYVGRHRAPRPLLLRRPIIGGVAVAVLLFVPAALAATGRSPIGPGSGKVADGSTLKPTDSATGTPRPGLSADPTDPGVADTSAAGRATTPGSVSTGPGGVVVPPPVRYTTTAGSGSGGSGGGTKTPTKKPTSKPTTTKPTTKPTKTAKPTTPAPPPTKSTPPPPPTTNPPPTTTAAAAQAEATTPPPGSGSAGPTAGAGSTSSDAAV